MFSRFEASGRQERTLLETEDGIAKCTSSSSRGLEDAVPFPRPMMPCRSDAFISETPLLATYAVCARSFLTSVLHNFLSIR